MAVPSHDPLTIANPRMRPLPYLIFMSRWLQLPLYLGLILAQGVYVWHFWVELIHLIEAAFGSQDAVQKILTFENAGRTLSGKAVLVADNPDLAGDFEANANDIASPRPASNADQSPPK